MGWEDRAYNRDDAGGGPAMRLPKPTSLATVIMIVCAVIFVIMRLSPGGGALGYYLPFGYFNGFWYRQPWRWLTFQYAHGRFGELIFNLISIYFLMPILEQFWGWRRTLALYTGAGIAACVTLAFVRIFFYEDGIAGAEAGVFGILGAIAVLGPQMNVSFMMIVPTTMRTLAIFYAVLYALITLIDNEPKNIAMLGGLGFGALAAWIVSGPALRNQLERWEDYKAQRTAAAERNEQQEIDRILAKVGEKGMQSLTGGEKRTLARASQSQRKRDAARRR